SQVYSTYSDNQTAVTINVLQGERSRAADNHSLGTFNLEGIPAAPRGVPQIEVTFDIDANGIVHVSAKDLGTGKENKVTISGSSNLSKEEIERMTKEAEAHAEEDKKFQELVEARNRADQLISATEKTLKENPDKVSEGDKKNIEAAIEELKKVKDGDDKSAIDSAMEKLTQAANKFAEELYKNAQAQQQAGAQANASSDENKSKKDDDVAEAEVVD
ncbi:Hsp70 family protein, partial [Fusobacterium sp.]